MEFLLECVGFAPDTDQDWLRERVLELGEPVAWRGPGGQHLKLRLADGIELRLDQEEGDDVVTLLPYFAEPNRLRVGVNTLNAIQDSPFDALLTGWVAPPRPGRDPGEPPGAYRLAAWLTDARKLPRTLRRGHVLAISVAGFSLDVTFIGPNSESPRLGVQELPRGAYIDTLGGPDDPGGCSDVSARIKEVRQTRNELTGELIEIIEVDAPERPLRLFVSPWQLERDGLPAPRPGYRIDGTFLFNGRITGGLPGPARRARRNFG